MADRFPLILNTSANQIQEIASGDTLDLTGNSIKNVGVLTATSLDVSGDIDVDGHTNLDNVSIAGVSTFAGAIDLNADLDVDGHTNLDNVNVAGVVTATTINATTFAGALSGNAATATALQNARTIGGVSFDGTANINLPGVNASGNQDTSGNATTATTAATATNVTVSANNSTNETVYPVFVDGATGAQGAETDTGLTYNPSTGNLSTTTFTGNLTGNVTGTIQTAAQPNITSVGTLSSLNVSGDVSIGGTLTYEDVTNIDSVGLITARSGVISPYADIDDFVSVGSNIHLGNAGVVTATTFSGSGASLTNLNGSNIASGTVPVARIGTGTKNSSTFYRGDGTFAVVTSVGGNTGVDFNDNVKARFGTGNDLEIFHDGTSSQIKNHVGDSDLNITCTGQGTLTLGVETSSGSNYKGITLHYLGKLEPRVHDSIDLGSSSKRFKNCFFDVVQVDSQVKTNTIQNNTSADVFIRQYGATDHIKFRQGSSQSDGWNIQTGGHFVPSNNSAYDIGQTSSRVRNGYFTTVSAGSSISVGTGVTIESNGQATYVGIVTASAFKLSDGSAVGGVVSDAQFNTVGGTNSGDSFSGTNAVRNTLYGFDTGTALTTGDNNTLLGYQAGDALTTSSENVIIGSSAGSGANQSTASRNVIMGYQAIQNQDNPSDQVAIGYRAMANQKDDAYGNVAVGSYALECSSNQEVYNNTCIGMNAGRTAENGFGQSVFVGYSAGEYVNGPDYCTGIGFLSMRGNSSNKLTGYHNTGLGYRSLTLVQGAGEKNTALGSEAGDTITTGSNNICIGYNTQASSATISNEVTIGDANINHVRVPGIGVSFSEGGAVISGIVTATNFVKADGSAVGGVTSDGNKNTVGGSNAAGNLATSPDAAIHNTFFGYQAGKSLTTGDENVFIGKDAGETTTVASRFIAIGADAASLGSNPNQGVAIGFEAYKNGTASHTVAIGMEALESVTTSDGNIAVGTQALQNCVTYQNTAIGYRAGKNATSGPRNIAIGVDAMFNSSTSKSLTGEHNIALGYQAAVNIESGTHNLAIGNEAGYSITSGDYCLGIGNQARPGSTGNRNISIGSLSGSNVTTGDDNINIGLFSGYSQTGSNKNITVGREAGRYITSGEENICLGYQAGSSINGGSGNIILGKNADVASAGENNACVIGATTLESFRVPFADFRLVKNSTSDHMILLGTSDSTAAAWSGTRQGIKLVGSQPLMYLVDNGNTSGDDAYVGHSGSSLYVAKRGGKIAFQTAASGAGTTNRWTIESDGHMLPSSNGSYDIGSSSYRVRNIYTSDIDLSNKGGKNDVDGTWGSYTIQEGEDDLFLINKRSGKKYKFNLTEVS